MTVIHPVPLLLLACVDTSKTTVSPALGDTVAVVPSGGLPAELAPQEANNNLDVAWFEGRVYLAFRTAPSHFASDETVLYVVSSADQATWDFEAAFSLGTDLREPRFLALDGRLLLYFAVLGDDPLDFEPQGSLGVEHLGPGDWSEPREVFEPGFIPWRARVFDGTPYIIGYTGGENIYDADAEPVQIWWLTTEDGWTWTAAVPDQPVVLTGGGSETDFTFLDDGTLVAVVRNEAGDETGFGSKVCRAEAGDLGTWSCAADPRKYDSPLVFRQAGAVWLVARRNVTESGAFDLGYEDLSLEQRSAAYALDYWQQPKRCALWRVDPDALSVSWVLDLPSRGDTCFPSVLQTSPWTATIYNYSSPIDGPDLSWIEGQTGETLI